MLLDLVAAVQKSFRIASECGPCVLGAGVGTLKTRALGSRRGPRRLKQHRADGMVYCGLDDRRAMARPVVVAWPGDHRSVRGWASLPPGCKGRTTLAKS